ncbi:MAG: exodeoxyribonuclease VII large subunit, partial [Phycisphaerae bacterium]
DDGTEVVPAPAVRQADPISVSEVTAMVKSALAAAFPRSILVAGEISNFKHHSSGHAYLTLKDGKSELSCVMWRSQASSLKFRPEDGMEVVASGRIDVYERSGRYQLYINRLEPRGVGALELAFRQLVEKLRGEGLFEADRKLPVPVFPQRLAIVTSPTGAAIADMVRTLRRRYPAVDVLILPARVQGDGSAQEVASAIRMANRLASDVGGIDTLIVARGGGSLEDLWAFNEEVVARAIVASKIPVISGVGHETDVTVADMVADVRAATPTAAAELAVPVLADVQDQITYWSTSMRRGVTRALAFSNERLTGQMRRQALSDPYFPVRQREQAVDEAFVRLERQLAGAVGVARSGLDALEALMHRHAPHLKLSRAGVALSTMSHQIAQAWLRGQSHRLQRLADVARRIELANPVHRITSAQALLGRLQESMGKELRHRFVRDADTLRHLADRLVSLGHESVLRRGYSMTRLQRATKKGKPVLLRSIREVHDGDKIVTHLADGEVESVVVNQEQLELFGGEPKEE